MEVSERKGRNPRKKGRKEGIQVRKEGRKEGRKEERKPRKEEKGGKMMIILSHSIILYSIKYLCSIIFLP